MTSSSSLLVLLDLSAAFVSVCYSHCIFVKCPWKALYKYIYTLSVSQIIVDEFWPTLLQNVCWHLFFHSSLKLPATAINLVEVWTLTGPLQHLDSFLFQPFCCRFAGVLDHCPVAGPNFSQALAARQMIPHKRF